MTTPAPEIWFYHLERTSLDRVLPGLLEKSLANGWRANVRIGNEDRLKALDDLLWTYRQDSFLPHGSRADGFEVDQPIYLTCADDNPNQADVLFLVDGAPMSDPQLFKRCITIFDARDSEAVEDARRAWKQAKADGYEVTYWQQTAKGGWQKQG